MDFVTLITEGGPWSISAVLAGVVVYQEKRKEKLHDKIYELGTALIKNTELNTAALNDMADALHSRSLRDQ